MFLRTWGAVFIAEFLEQDAQYGPLDAYESGLRKVGNTWQKGINEVLDWTRSKEYDDELKVELGCDYSFTEPYTGNR